MENTQKTSGLRPKTYNVMLLAVQDGINLGWARAHKHQDNPDENVIKQCMENEIMNSISEWFIYDEEE